MDRIVARGQWGTVEWAVDADGEMPAREFFDALDERDRPKLLALFRRLANEGKIPNREKFRKLGQQGGRKFSHLWEFKSFQLRFLGDFRGKRFLLAHVTRKKKDELSESDKSRTVRILAENDDFEGRKRGGK